MNVIINMKKKYFKYIITITVLCLIGILLMDYLILPSYVGYNNEHYLPDIRGEFMDKANYQLREIGFQTEVVMAPFSDAFIPGTVIKMFPRAFTKVKEGRAINLTIAGKMEDIKIPNFIPVINRAEKIFNP